MNSTSSKPSHVTVVGAGIMGCDIAAIFLNAGCRVDCLSRDPARRGERQDRVARSVAQLGGTFQPSLLRQVETYDDVAWAETELVIETVPENLATKRAVFAEIDARTNGRVPVASNASGLPISRIAEGLELAHRALGLHFFLPAHLVPLVEVVRGSETDPDIIDQVHGMMAALGRVPVKVNRDTPGFLANRIQHALMREAFAALDEGLATPEDVDAAVRYGFGMRYVAAGPLLQKEFAGLDTQLAAATSIYPGLSGSTEPSRTLRGLVDQGRLGTKSLSGFWDWTPESAREAQENYERILLEALKLLKQPRHGLQSAAKSEADDAR